MEAKIRATGLRIVLSLMFLPWPTQAQSPGPEPMRPLGELGVELAVAPESKSGDATVALPPDIVFRIAELRLSDVDDSMVISLNGNVVDRSGVGEVHPFLDVTRFLREGENTIAVHVGNERGGACGGRVFLRRDNNDARVSEWEFRKSWAPSEIPCVVDNITFWKFTTPPPNFHRVEIRLTEVDDTMHVGITNPSFNLLLDSTYLQYSRPYRDISKFVVSGENTLHVRIGNEAGGPCGGRLNLRIDGVPYNPPAPWYWHKDWAPSEYPCFEHSVILRLP